MIGDVKTSEIFALKPFDLKEDTLYSLAYNTSIKLEILSSTKYKLTYHKGNTEYVGYYLFNRKISNDLGIFSIDKTADFSRQPYDSKNFRKRNFTIRLADKNLLTDIYQSAIKADPISKQASMLQISIQGSTPSKNEAFLNKLCEQIGRAHV